MAKAGRKPEGPIGLDKILTPAEERQFMDYMVSVSGDEGGMANWLMFGLMLMTGMRVSELCALRVKDTPVYLGVNAVHVHESKGRKSRDIPIGERLTESLLTYLKDYRPATLPASVRASDRRKPVFYSELKRPYGRDRIAYKLKKFALQAGLVKHFTPHMCRHTFATLSLFEKRIEISLLQALLGHSKLAITQRYLHTAELMNPGLGNALDRGEGVLRRGSSEIVFTIVAVNRKKGGAGNDKSFMGVSL